MPAAAVPYHESLAAKNYLTISPPRNVRINLTSPMTSDIGGRDGPVTVNH